MQDMHFASKSIEELAEKQRNHSATVVIAANAEAAAYFRNASDAKVVETSGTTIDEIIANISSALGWLFFPHYSFLFKNVFCFNEGEIIALLRNVERLDTYLPERQR